MTDFPRQIGVYTIERELGRGGMGVVYLARDPRLDRQVAIKVLPDVVARDPERLARFEREARLLASLNHPHIAGIHGIEEAGGSRFLVLEYLRGETLASRLKRGALKSAAAVDACRQIAAALETAHENGIIHRDLKPGNVMLDEDDTVKVLDFGLAKGDADMGESSSDLSASPTVTVGATAIGVVLGTAAYMSPEQARGKPVDRRTDIWSFGCVLYECLTGKQLFGGETVSDTIAKILEREPDWNALPAETPERVRELIRRCLEKKAKDRLRDIGDARIELEEVDSGKASSISGVSQVALESKYRTRLRMAWGVAAILAVGVVGLLLAFMRAGAPPEDAVRFQVQEVHGISISGGSEDVRISPDGKTVVFIAADSTGTVWLYLRELGSLDVRRIPNTKDAQKPFWSPDSRHVGFVSDGKLRKVALDEGQVEVICDSPPPRGASWSGDWIVFAGGRGPIYKVPAAGGAPVAVTAIDSSVGDGAHRFPEFLPDGKRFMYVALPERRGQLPVYVGDLDGMEPVEIMRASGRPEYAEPGYLLYRRGQQLVAHPFDAARLQLSGNPLVIGEAAGKSVSIGAPAVSASRNGRLAHPSAFRQTTQLVWSGMDGKLREPLRLEEGSYTSPDIAPDGRFVAFDKETSPEESDIWIYDVERELATRFTFGPGRNGTPRWSPDGRSLLFASDRDGPVSLYVQSVADGGPAKRLPQSDAPFKNVEGWAPDGEHVLYSDVGPNTGLDIWIAPVNGEGEPQPYAVTQFSESSADVSPDGRWAVYQSNESGTPEIYVSSFPRPGRKHRISQGGGLSPIWTSDGRSIFYVSFDQWAWLVPIQTGSEVRVGTPRRLYRFSPSTRGGTLCSHDDCGLMVMLTTPDTGTSLTVISGWVGEVESR